MGYMPGALFRHGDPNDPAQADVVQVLTTATEPDETTFAGVAEPGALLVETATPLLYQNGGTLETPAWEVVGAQTTPL